MAKTNKQKTKKLPEATAESIYNECVISLKKSIEKINSLSADHIKELNDNGIRISKSRLIGFTKQIVREMRIKLDVKDQYLVEFVRKLRL